MAHPHLLQREQAVLVLVDLQERLHREVVRRGEVAANASRLAQAARLLGVPIIVTEHAAKAFGPTLEELRSALKGYEPVHKIVFSCFGANEFRRRLFDLASVEPGRGERRQLLVAGLETHICVCQTALDAVADGYAVHVARDACASRTEENHAVGVEKMAGGGVIPASTETAIFELLGRADTEEFKKLLPIIKRK